MPTGVDFSAEYFAEDSFGAASENFRISGDSIEAGHYI